MNKRDALKLKPGDLVVFGAHVQSAKCIFRRLARVEFVTPRGGVRLRCTDEAGNVTGTPEWIPYHLLICKT